MIVDVLSDALQEVLDETKDLNVLFNRYGERLKDIPLEYEACTVEVSTKQSMKSVEDLAKKIDIKADDLAKVNGCDKSDPVLPQTILLVPKGGWPGLGTEV